MKEFAPRRGTAPAAYVPELPHHAPNAALLIDFDNVTMGIRSDLQQQLKNLLGSEVFKGKISVQRAYADWRRYPQYIVPLSEASIDLIFAPAFGSNKKNATDIRLAIDALELVFTRPEIGTFVLLSGDSDFSSLVLKLKEYGKYVIGIGIRESSSDLLIQNCDEYYGYSELTGLLKESDVVYQRRDPWELVIEAVLKMDQRNDVMRSDRLKQVMQEIDPEFDEKNAGYNRYAKFLQEAQRRGLIDLRKMDNGQYEIGLGPNANTPLSDAGDAPTKAAPSRSRERAPARPREPRTEREPRAEREGGRGRGRGREREVRTANGMSLADAFELMRKALLDLGASGDESTDAGQARERMVQLAGNDDDPVFEEKRFHRLLRQAHDAGVIDLVKSGDDVYLLKLRPQEAQPVEEPREEPAEERRDEGERPRSRRGGRGRGGRGRGEGRRDDKPREAEEAKEESGGPERAQEPVAAESQASRNPRFRRGGRGAPSGAPADTEQAPPGPVGADRPAAESRPVTPPTSTEGRRSLRGRPGRRAVERAPGEGQAHPGFVPGLVEEPGETTQRPAAQQRPEAEERPVVRQQPRPEPSESAAHPPARHDEPAQEGEEGGLFRRMTAAFQRAVGGDKHADQ